MWAPRHDDVQGPLGRRAEARGPEGNHGVLLGLLPAEPGRVAGRARRREAQRLAQRRALAPLRRLLDDLRGGVRLLHLRPDGLARRRVDDHDVQLVSPALPQEL